MSILFTNNAQTLLNASIITSDTSLTVTSGTGALFPNPVGANADYFYCTLTNGVLYEIIKVTARTGDTFTTITRAQEGTSAQNWPPGTQVSHRVTAQSLYDISGAGVSGQLNYYLGYI